LSTYSTTYLSFKAWVVFLHKVSSVVASDSPLSLI